MIWNMDHSPFAIFAHEGSSNERLETAERLLGLTRLQFMQADLAGQHRADDEFGAIMRIEQAARLGQIAVDGAWRYAKHPGDLLVGTAASCKHDAIARPRMKPGLFDRRRHLAGQTARRLKDRKRVVEGKSVAVRVDLGGRRSI